MALLLMGTLVVGSVERLVIEPRVMSSWSELLEHYLDFREMYGPIVPPSVSYGDVYARITAGDFSFLAEDWSFRFTGGTYYVDEASKLAKLKTPLHILIYEDIQRGDIVILSSVDGEKYKGEAIFDAPEFYESDVSVLPPEEMHVYFFDELAPRRIVWAVTLKPEADAWSDLVLNARSAPAPTESVAEADGLGYGGMMMGIGASYSNDLYIAGEPVSNGLNVIVYAQEGFTNRVELYTCSDLISNEWSVAVENLRPVSTNPEAWWYAAAEDSGFFTGGNMDVDTDSDGLCDDREKYVHKTEPDDPDTDGDGYSDGWEILYGLDPLLMQLNAEEDSDGDGFVNLYEYVYDSDPTDDSSVPPTTRYVSQAGSHILPFTNLTTAATNIQAALDVATNDYEIIEVADGVYTGEGNNDLDFKGKKLMLRSANGPTNCVIDGGSSNRGLVFQTGETRESVVWGIQFYHGFAEYGGALLCSNASPLIEGCIFSENEAGTSGGGIHAENSDIKIRNCRFEANFAFGTGGACSFKAASAEVLNSVMTGNETFAMGMGGALDSHQSTLLVRDTVMSNNHSSCGAVYGDSGTARFENCLISDGSGWFSGGGYFHSSLPEFSRCTFQNNTDDKDYLTSGGALYLYNCTSRVENCLFTGNTSDEGSITSQRGETVIQNCTIVSNDSMGVYGLEFSEVLVRNTVFWTNTSWEVASSGSVMEVSFCCVPEGYGESNLAEAPKFIEGGYQLSPVSPCIDRGSAENAPPEDIVGRVRWNHPWRVNGTDASTVDIGAYEYTDEDVDSDNLGDLWEVYYFGNTNVSSGGDDDIDGLSTFTEYQMDINPNDPDMDDDTLTDGAEVNHYGTDPQNADSDGDTLSDADEINLYASNPLSSDSDGDELPDAWEVLYGLNPNVPNATEDPDTDGLNNLWEYKRGSDPTNPDTDGDTLADGAEHDNGTSPVDEDSDGDGQTDDADTEPWGGDSDGDGIPYDWEVEHGLNFALYDGEDDPDQDNLLNVEEYLADSDPQDEDSDNDTLFDGEEVHTHQTNPLYLDTDFDLLSDADEIAVHQTQPLNSDTDGDGMMDGFEVDHGCDPLVDDADGDTDGDGLSNLYEAEYQYPKFGLQVTRHPSGPPWNCTWSEYSLSVNGARVSSSSGVQWWGEIVTLYGTPGSRLNIQMSTDPENPASLDFFNIRNCLAADGAVFPYQCDYRIEKGNIGTPTYRQMLVPFNDDDDDGNGQPDHLNEIIDGPDDREDMAEIIFDKLVIHESAPGVFLCMDRWGESLGVEDVRFFRGDTEAKLGHDESIGDEVRAGTYSVLVEGTEGIGLDGRNVFEPALRFANSSPNEASNWRYLSECHTTVIDVDLEFEETVSNNGFDDTVDPPWLVVPVNNPPNQNTVKVNIEPSAAISQVYFTIDDTAKATVSPVQASSSPQTLTLTGVAKGHTVLRARVGSSSGPVCKTLNICVRDKKVVNVDFHFMQDNASHQTSRSTSEADSFISTLNTIWTPQANVVFQKGNVDSPTVITDLGTVIEWYPTNPANEWDDIVAFRNGVAPDVFFVWEYEQDGTPATDNADAAQLNGDILFEDSAGTQVGETLAHEMGHHFGINPSDYTDHQEQLMHAYTDIRGQKITHAQVDQVPQP